MKKSYGESSKTGAIFELSSQVFHIFAFLETPRPSVVEVGEGVDQIGPQNARLKLKRTKEYV